jgi:hypothetical protein
VFGLAPAYFREDETGRVEIMAKTPSGKNISGRGQRELRAKVKTARGRKLSSTLWLERQLNDPYVQRAKREGYRGRAAYKIMELDDKYRFLVPGARVVDLGCAPGGWCQVAVPRINALGGKGRARRWGGSSASICRRSIRSRGPSCMCSISWKMVPTRR